MSTTLVAAAAMILLSQEDDRQDRPDILSPPAASRDVRSDQIKSSSHRRDDTAPMQISAERRTVSVSSQLTRGRTAESSTPLSSRAESRRTATARVDGSDRCDPAQESDDVPACADPIEARSQNFGRPTPPGWSPEQKLLIDQKLRAASGPTRLGDGLLPGDVERADPTSAAGQTIRAISERDENSAAAATATAVPAGTLPNGVSPETLIVLDSILNNPAPR